MMADVLSPSQRSFCMSRITGKNTKPEVLLRKSLWQMGLRYRLNTTLPGRPDVYFAGRRIAVFIDGCFWHRCPIHFRAPKTNKTFWIEKIGKNVTRDRKVNELLELQNILPIRVWEHEIKDDLLSTARKVHNIIIRRDLIP
jgi:DNA mismatch endonuclease, patch repair protein